MIGFAAPCGETVLMKTTVDPMNAAIARLKAGGRDGARCGVPFVRQDGGYIFKVDGGLHALLARIGVTLDGLPGRVRDSNECDPRPGLTLRGGNLEDIAEGFLLLSGTRIDLLNCPNGAKRKLSTETARATKPPALGLPRVPPAPEAIRRRHRIRRLLLR